MLAATEVKMIGSVKKANRSKCDISSIILVVEKFHFVVVHNKEI